jgi:hypothetical protein
MPDDALRDELDGVHFTDASAATAAAWPGPQIVSAYRSHVPAGP